VCGGFGGGFGLARERLVASLDNLVG